MNVISQGLFANAIQLALSDLNRFLGLCIAKDVIKIIIKKENGIYYYLHVNITWVFLYRQKKMHFGRYNIALIVDRIGS